MITDTPQLPESLVADRREALTHILTRLPTPVIEPLVRGIEQADQFTYGRLFSGESGGCAVGVLLRSLYPAFDGGQGAEKSIGEAHERMCRDVPHLRPLEMVFDRTVKLASEQMGEDAAVEATALWVHAEAKAELKARHDRVRAFDQLLETSLRADQEQPVKELI